MNILSTTVTRAASVVILIVLLIAVQVEAASTGRLSLAVVTYGHLAVAALLVIVIVALVAKLVKQHGAVKAMTRMAALLIVVFAALGGLFGLFAFSASLHQGGYPHNRVVVLRDFACAVLIAIFSITLFIRVSRRHPELKMMKGVIQLIFALVCAVGPPVVFIAFIATLEWSGYYVALAASVVGIAVLICVASATIMLQRRSGMSDRFVALGVGLAPLVWMCADGLRHQQALVVALGGLACLAAVSCAAAWLCARRAWDQRGRLRAAAIVVTTLVFYVYLAWDAPTQKAYTWEDIPMPTTDVEASRQTLCKLTKTASPLLTVETPGGQGANYGRRRTAARNRPPIEKLMDDFGRKATPAEVLACAEQIENAWGGSTNYRAVIAELDTYPAIPCTGRGIYAPLINYLEFRKAVQLCALHARLTTYQGAATEGASNLVQFYSVVRKRLP